MQRRAGGLALGVIECGQHAPPQLGLPKLVFGQLVRTGRFAQDVTPGGPVLQPIGSVNLVLVKKVSQSAGELQQTVRLVATQKTRHRLEHRIVQASGQQSHQPPGHGQFVQRRVGRHIVRAQHLPVSAPQKARRQLHPRGRAHAALACQLDLDPLGHAVALHQHHLALERVQRVHAQPSRQGVGQHLGAVAVQGNETGGNGRDRHAVNKCRHGSEGTRIAAIVPATRLMARALHCPIFKHQPPRQSGCGLAQLFKDLSTPLGTVFGGKPALGETSLHHTGIPKSWHPGALAAAPALGSLSAERRKGIR